MEALAVLAFLAAGAAVVFLVLWTSEKGRREGLQRQLAQTDYAARQALSQRDAGLWEANAISGKQANNLATTKQMLGEAAKRIDALTTELKQAIRQREDVAKTAMTDVAAAEKRAGSAVKKAEAALAAVAAKYVDEAHKWLVSKITPNNLETSRARFEKVVAFCAKHDCRVEPATVAECDRELVAAFKDAVRKDEARQQQQRIKEQIREEQRAEAEFKRAQEQATREEARIQDALTKARRAAHDEHSVEVAALQAQLLALQEKKRALSMAQQTRAGHIYVISNVGSFGDGVLKVGMTRRLEPMDRVLELGDASVPFPFDVHLMISCGDAPKLENTLHRELHAKRMNKVNLRKEFFRATLDEVVAVVKREHGHVDYRATPDAFEYHETRAIEDRGTFGTFTPPTRDEQLAETDEGAAN